MPRPAREIRDPEEARRFVAQGLWFQRAAAPRAAAVDRALAWALEAAGSGEPIPPIGVVADVGRLVVESDHPEADDRPRVVVPGWPPGPTRAYDDLVLGKLGSDPSIGRASDALARYRGRDLARGLAFVLGRFRERSGFGGVLINPVVLRPVAGRTGAKVLDEGWASLERDGPMPMLLELYAELVESARDLGDALAPEDVFELEHGTALAAFGQRVALRQVLQSAGEFEAAIPAERPRPSGRRRDDAATWFLDEDAYPVGGFSSISTRGSIESLLHSQLAFMEPGERPDLFDIKFVRDELLYYSRDENQFRRRRRSFVFALHPDLERARVKDAALPRQRGVLLLGALVAAVHRLVDWLGEDALTFEFLFLEVEGLRALDGERELIELIFREPIARGEVVVAPLPAVELAALRDSRSRRSLCRTLLVSSHPAPVDQGTPPPSTLTLDGPIPRLEVEGEGVVPVDAEDPIGAWRATLALLLGLWA